MRTTSLMLTVVLCVGGAWAGLEDMIPAAKEVETKYPPFRIAVEELITTPRNEATAGPLVGPYAQIREAVSQFFSMFQSLGHTIRGTWTHPDTVFVEGDVHYTRQDGSRVTLPFLNRFKMQADKVQDYSIYIDPTPLAE